MMKRTSNFNSYFATPHHFKPSPSGEDLGGVKATSDSSHHFKSSPSGELAYVPSAGRDLGGVKPNHVSRRKLRQCATLLLILTALTPSLAQNKKFDSLKSLT